MKTQDWVPLALLTLPFKVHRKPYSVACVYNAYALIMK